MAAKNSSKKKGKKLSIREIKPTIKRNKFVRENRLGDIKDIKEKHLMDLIEGYLNQCLEREEFPIIIGFINYCGCGKSTYHNIKNKREDLKPTLDRLEDFIEEEMTRELIVRKNCTGLIFYMKNKFGWQDRIENKFDIKIEYPDKESRI